MQGCKAFTARSTKGEKYKVIIILEGPDGSGKTTLANQLAAQTGYPVVHRSNPKTEEEKQQMLAMYKEAVKKSRNVIFDRAWYSEMVYGPIMRDAAYISYPAMYELERGLCKVGSILIYCTDSPNILWKRCLKRGEDYIKNYNTFSSICAGFEELMAVPHLIPVVRYEYKEM